MGLFPESISHQPMLLGDITKELLYQLLSQYDSIVVKNNPPFGRNIGWGVILFYKIERKTHIY